MELTLSYSPTLSGRPGQVADRDEISSRLHTAWLDRCIYLARGRSYRVTEGARQFVALPVVQKGRNVRFQVRNGEFFPGLVLQRLGALDSPCMELNDP